MKTIINFRKRSITCLVASIFIVSLLFKEAPAQNGLNFYSIRDGWNNYYQQHPNLITEQGSGFKDFKRWERFWLNRTDGSDIFERGNFTQYRFALSQYKEKHKEFEEASILTPNWKFLGPKGVDLQVHGLVNAVYVDTVNDKYRNTIYVGTNSSGIWKTNDGGNNWNNITDQSELAIPGINNITGDPNNGNILYAATGGYFPMSSDGYGIGVIKSIDYGQTWNIFYPSPATKAKTNLNSYKVLVDPSNSLRVYALIYDKVVRTLDGGQTWDTIFIAPRENGFNDEFLVLRDLEMKPGDPNTLYISSDYRHWAGRRRPHVWKISNATQNNPDSTRMDILFPGYKNCNERFELAVSPVSPSSIYAIGNDTIMVKTPPDTVYKEEQRVKVWKSDNNGQTWVKMLDTSNSALGKGINYWRMELLVSPTDTGVIYIGGLTMARLRHWDMNSKLVTQANYNNYHFDTRDAVIIRGSDTAVQGSSDVIFVGNDGGISKTTNGSQNWTNINGDGLDINQFWGIGSSDNNPDWIGGGTQDNGFFIKDPILGWRHTCEGDMGDVLIDFDQPNIIFSSIWIFLGREAVTRSFSYGDSWDTTFFTAAPESWIANWPFIMNPINPKILYLGAHNIYRSDNSMQSFTKIPMQLGGDTNAIAYSEPLISIAISQTDTSVMYAGYAGPHFNVGGSTHKFLKTINRGVSWTDLTPNVLDDNQLQVFHNLGLTSIEISPTNEDSVWITFGGFNALDKYRVMVTGDSGATWRDYSKGLPNLPVNCIKYWKNGGGGLFVGTDVGIFYRGRNDSIWQSFNAGLPTTIVSDIEIVDTINVIRIGTYGRGIWEADLSCKFVSDTLLITSDTTWATDMIMDRSVKVKQPAKLTIQSTIKFPPRGKIYIEPGAKLYVEGGTLTNACFNMWQGIEVWGNSSLTQTTNNQGYVNLSDNAVIENARIAITTCKTFMNGEINWLTTGGIVMAKNCTFRNNYKAVQFLTYNQSNRSLFTKVNFETTAPFIDGHSSPSDL